MSTQIWESWGFGTDCWHYEGGDACTGTSADSYIWTTTEESISLGCFRIWVWWEELYWKMFGVLQSWACHQHGGLSIGIIGNWSKHAGSHPKLACLAHKYLATPATSVSCERLFSLPGHIVQKKQAALSSSNVTRLVCLSRWLGSWVACIFFFCVHFFVMRTSNIYSTDSQIKSALSLELMLWYPQCRWPWVNITCTPAHVHLVSGLPLRVHVTQKSF